MLPTLYDADGFSGGTMDRPALKLLLSDITEGRVDVVVVYKIDRLTRSISPQSSRYRPHHRQHNANPLPCVEPKPSHTRRLAQAPRTRRSPDAGAEAS